MILRELAHSRAGDKGNISNISVIAIDAKDWPLLKDVMTVARVEAHLQGFAHGEITRFELPNIHALNFVIKDALAGGVTRSIALDTHGKCLSSILLDMPIPMSVND